ncbi:MAG TPA: hypothetical protein PLV68_15000 [Ilumatobacteraceae bacterium]|nr:hypothetical protein [Ilumatobacteraceae bacterium]
MFGLATACTSGASEPVGRPDAEPLPISVLYRTERQYFHTIEDISAASDVVIIATVVSVDPADVPRPADEPDGSGTEFVRLSLRADTVLKGDVPSELGVSWEAYVVDNGARTLEIAIDGVVAPRTSDQVLLFLKWADPSQGALGITPESPWYIVTMDGIYWIDGDTVTSPITDPKRLASTVNGQSLADIVAAISATPSG